MFKILSICKGGGYYYCRTEPPHPKRNKNGLYPLHRVLLENKLKRLLGKNEIAHHIDGDKNNNHPNNLEFKTRSEHTKYHFPKNERINLICPQCLVTFKRLQSQINSQTKRGRKLYCSRKCSGIFSNYKKHKAP